MGNRLGPLRLSPPRRRLRELLASLVTTTPQSISRCGRLALVLLTPSTSTSCPTATATLMPASTTSPRSVRNPLSRGLRSLVSSCRGPTWLWLRQVRRVAVPTRLVLLRQLPGTVLRLSWLHATAPTAPLQESWPLLVSFLWLKRLSACSQYHHGARFSSDPFTG